MLTCFLYMILYRQYLFREVFMKSIIESPFAGNVERNRMYARLSMNIALTEHDESPLAFHTIYTQCLSDADPMHRKMGITRSFPWYEVADKVVYMIDRGISTGMHDGFITAQEMGRNIEFRTASTSPKIIDEVASWNTVEEAEQRLNEMKEKAIKDKLLHFTRNGDITPFALERRSEINMIMAVNGNDFKSPVRESYDSVLER